MGDPSILPLYLVNYRSMGITYASPPPKHQIIACLVGTAGRLRAPSPPPADQPASLKNICPYASLHLSLAGCCCHLGYNIARGPRMLTPSACTCVLRIRAWMTAYGTFSWCVTTQPLSPTPNPLCLPFLRMCGCLQSGWRRPVERTYLWLLSCPSPTAPPL